MKRETNVIAILENDVPLSPRLEELAETIHQTVSAPLALIKQFMLFAHSDFSEKYAGEELDQVITEMVTGWIQEPGIAELLKATVETPVEHLEARLLSLAGIDKIIVMTVFKEFFTFPEVQAVFGWKREVLEKRMRQLADYLETGERTQARAHC